MPPRSLLRWPSTGVQARTADVRCPNAISDLPESRVSVKVYDWLMPGQPRKFTDAVLEVIGFSCLNYAALSWWLIRLMLTTQPKQLLDWTVDLQLFLIWFIVPALWPFAYYRLSSTALYSRYFGSPIPTAWDKAFRRRKGGWVI